MPPPDSNKLTLDISLTRQLNPGQQAELLRVVSREIALGAEAVHVFGSLPRGQFVNGHSDIDLASDVALGNQMEHEIMGRGTRIEVWRESDDGLSFLDPSLPHKTIYKR